ncbi:MAG: dihydroorotase [Rhodobacterales bacterium]|nr:dihydroorotase [Rhodobacterales bacterium]
MSEPFDLLLRGGTCVLPWGDVAVADVGIAGGRIVDVGDLTGTPAAEVVDCTGLHVLPGVIDSQVHFREPGLEHKEDMGTGTAAAALGGVTAVMDMPNTRPPTASASDLADKCRRAKDRAWVDMAFFVGASAANVEDLGTMESLPGCAGIQMFLGSSFANLLVEDDATLAQVLAQGRRRVVVHCEDERRLRERLHIAREGRDVALHPVWRDETAAVEATRQAVALAKGLNRRLHLLHVSSAAEMAFLKDHHDMVTIEVTPQHLTLSAPDVYQRLGTKAQMNPPIREAAHREALWAAVRAGLVDVIGTDHAPHTLADKAKPYPQSPSGMPGVQTLVPVMLTHVAEGRLSLSRFVDLTSAGPARVFGLAGRGRIALGFGAHLTVVDLAAKRRITDGWIASKCGWTPFDGMNATGWPVMTVVGGRVVMRDGQLLGPPQGTAIRFLEVG